MPTFNFGKQCCPDPYTGKNKHTSDEHAFKVSNALTMSTVDYRYVSAVLDWAAKVGEPITKDAFDSEVTIQGWDAMSAAMMPVALLARRHRPYDLQKSAY